MVKTKIKIIYSISCFSNSKITNTTITIKYEKDSYILLYTAPNSFTW